ncbi:MAG: carboxypeptidase M32 [Tuberibacillus sp.]
MGKSIQETEKGYFDYIRKMKNYEEALSLMAWDLRTGAPKKGVEQRSEVIGTLSEDVFNMSTSAQLKEYLDALSEPSAQSELSEVTKRSVEKSLKEYNHLVNIPAEEYKDYVILRSKAESVWEEAKAKSDFSMLAPYLEKLVDFKHRMVDYWGYKGNKYDALLDQYEPGVTVETIDRVFGELREQIIPLVQEIKKAKAPDRSFMYGYFPKEKQRDFGMYILKEMGYDFHSGRIDETEHPFQITLNPGDVRVTTNYKENDFQVAVFGIMHEGGHALYEQNISTVLIGTPLCEGTSMGIHESQSLFFENFVGRSRAFWTRYYEPLKSYAGGMFDGVDLDAFYRAVNVAGPSLIRIEADELTYPLHIIVRYEIEKGLFNGDLKVKDLPGIWNEKMEEYLGIRPETDREGVLQDIHWSGGDFGYFPSYALGYLYAAQFKNTMLKELPNFDDLLANGQIEPIRQWLTKNIHQYGSLKKPIEILQDVTGESVNAKYLVAHLTKKFRDVYRLG